MCVVLAYSLHHRPNFLQPHPLLHLKPTVPRDTNNFTGLDELLQNTASDNSKSNPTLLTHMFKMLQADKYIKQWVNALIRDGYHTFCRHKMVISAFHFVVHLKGFTHDFKYKVGFFCIYLFIYFLLLFFINYLC